MSSDGFDMILGPQVANQRSGVVFCFNEDLHGPKSENFPSVNAANQEEEESDYTLTRSHAQRSQAKEIFIYNVSFPTHSLLAYLPLICASLDLAWQPANPPPSIALSQDGCKRLWSGLTYTATTKSKRMGGERWRAWKGVSWELDLEESYRLGSVLRIETERKFQVASRRKNNGKPQADSEAESQVVNCEERRLPVQNSRPRRGGFEIENTIIDLQRMSHRYMWSAVPAGMEMWTYLGWKKKDGSQSLYRTLGDGIEAA
ncbi:hypothetical protein B0H13DRAFT_1903633 [Mycena leptocephala]|nr:hypothetical protein B0H13DRAFT_1903633 [Mycena leptocephala]